MDGERRYGADPAILWLPGESVRPLGLASETVEYAEFGREVVRCGYTFPVGAKWRPGTETALSPAADDVGESELDD